MFELHLQKMNIGIKQHALFQQAMTHKSYANENSVQDNERLEFLGDALVNTIISLELYQRYPSKSEGQLSKMRAHLINEKSLATRALDLQLNEQLKLGKGEHKSLGAENPRLLASVFEALVAAIYLDSGMDALGEFVRQLFHEDLMKIENFEKFDMDFKSQFQEFIQKKYQTTPVYHLIKNEKDFSEVEVQVQGASYAIGVGKNRKMAEQDAAKKALMKAEK